MTTPSLPRVTPETFEREVLQRGGSVLVLFDDGSDVSRTLAGVLAAAVQGRVDRISGFVADADAFADMRREYEEQRHAVDTYHLDLTPVIALFRGGKLITTFEPWLHYHGRRLWRQDLAGQFETFLTKMVDYDPSKVHVQKNLQLDLD